MKPRRHVNKKLIDALTTYGQTTHAILASSCDPPMVRSAVSQLFLAGESGNGRLMEQIAELLRPVFEDLLREVLHIDRHQFLDHLFPPVSQDTGALGQKEGEKPLELHEIEEETNDQARAPAVCRQDPGAFDVGGGEQGIHPG